MRKLSIFQLLKKHVIVSSEAADDIVATIAESTIKEGKKIISNEIYIHIYHEDDGDFEHEDSYLVDTKKRLNQLKVKEIKEFADEALEAHCEENTSEEDDQEDQNVEDEIEEDQDLKDESEEDQNVEDETEEDQNVEDETEEDQYVEDDDNEDHILENPLPCDDCDDASLEDIMGFMLADDDFVEEANDHHISCGGDINDLLYKFRVKFKKRGLDVADINGYELYPIFKAELKKFNRK